MAVNLNARGARLSVWAVLMLIGLGLAAQTVRMRMGEAAVERRMGNAAVTVRPQNGWGLALVAHGHFERGQTALARQASIEALRRTPLATSAMRTLARSLDKLNGAGGGEAAWQVASTMGWRDKQTQLWAVLRAISNGEAEIFAMRADALLRAGDRDGLMAALIRQLVTEPRIRAPFVERLTRNPEWRQNFFWTDKPLGPREVDGLVATLMDLRRTSTPPSRHEARATIEALIRLKRFDQAIALDRAVAPERGRDGQLIDDPGFDRPQADYSRSSSPFDWMILVMGYASAALDESEGRSMTITAQGQHAQSPVRRFVALRPGRYALSFSMRGERNSPAAIRVRVNCAAATETLAESPPTPLPNSAWQTRRLEFATGPDCPIVEIGLGSTGTAGGEAQFDNVVLQRVGSR